MHFPRNIRRYRGYITKTCHNLFFETILMRTQNITVLVTLTLLANALLHASDRVLLETESFDTLGGWVVDQQFMDQMGSPFLLAHGLGDPVTDATTTAHFPAPGRYRLWVRTRDWVAPWKAPGAPGRFQVILDGKTVPVLFGTEGAAWHWQDGGLVDVSPETKVALHDLTGFEGRCDALLFCGDPGYRPPDNLDELTKLRRELLGLPDQPENGGTFDLVVVGGGIAGTCTALSAARLGLTVALIQDRPVLGGNGSSEVRVWPEGKINQPPYPRIGDVVAELVLPKKTGNAGPAESFADDRKLAAVRAEPRITLLLDHRVNQAQAKDGLIHAVTAQHTRTGRRTRIEGRWFADCTGDGVVGYLSGADYEITREQHMGASNLWSVQETAKPEQFPKCLCQDNSPIDTAFTASTRPAPFPRCPWAIDLRNKDFPGRSPTTGKSGKSPLARLGGWFWESGFDKDPITEVEWMRDQNFRAMYGAWDTLKNVDGLYPNHKLAWAAYVAGKRESRRLMGDVILSADDFIKSKPYDDGCFPCTWSIDLHTPEPSFAKGLEGEEFISRATNGKYAGPYWAPYRCLYSRNIRNLFMAGRDISVTHDGLGPVRVMKTCGMMGEVVGMAASLCKQYDCSPRDVYAKHLSELKELMIRGVGKR